MSETASARSTIDYYHERKEELMRDILTENMPLEMSEGAEPFCQVCGRVKSEVREMHVEHPNVDAGQQREANGETPGGWQLLYMYERHFREENKTLWVVCLECHYLLHERRGDTHAKKLQKRHPDLRRFDDQDAQFVIRQRMRDAEYPV